MTDERDETPDTTLPVVRWRLQEQMARAGVRFATDLHRRLVETMGEEAAPSADQVSKLVRQAPIRLNLRTLAGICQALGCGPGDLLDFVDETHHMQISSEGREFINRVAREGRTPVDPNDVSSYTPEQLDALRALVLGPEEAARLHTRRGAAEDLIDESSLHHGRRQPLKPVKMTHTLADFGDLDPNSQIVHTNRDRDVSPE